MADMDLTSYAGLKAAVADYLERADMTARIPGWIKLAEAQISRDLRRTSLRATSSIFGPTFTIPATVAEIRSARLITSSTRLDTPLLNVTVEQLADQRALRSATGRPTHFAIRGSEMLLVPACDQAYTMEYTYFQKLTPLSDAVPSNVVLVEAPDAYLFGALKEASTFLDNDERTPLWEAKYNAALASLDRVRVGEETRASLRPARLPRTF